MTHFLRHINRTAKTVILGFGLVLITGCQSLAGPFNPGGTDIGQGAASTASEGSGSANPVRQVSAEATPAPTEQTTLAEKSRKTGRQVINLLSGREQENVPRAQRFYQEADALFRQAGTQSDSESKSTYKKAAKLFGKASEAAPGTALQQDAMYMQGESLFFADRLTDAAEVYEKLQKDFPRNRHLDRVAARLFSISRYWIDTVKANDSWFSFNFTDPKRPRLDVDGHAIRVLDQIRYDDPTGRLADDATMAAAAEYIRQKKFEEADEFLTDLRETFPDSEHMFLAHMLGIRCKLETYAGPNYSGLVLEEAETLVKQTRQRFPGKVAESEFRDMIARASAEIAFLKAERIAERAEYRDKQKNYGAARMKYNQLLKDYPDTPHAEVARARLAEIESLPAIPTQRLSWLTTIFPDDSRKTTPLEMNGPSSEQPTQPTKTLLR